MKRLSILIPCFNEEEVFPFLVERLNGIIQKLKEKGWDYEIILVDDGSKD